MRLARTPLLGRASSCIRLFSARTRHHATEARVKKDGDISSVFASLSNEAAEPLPDRFLRLKHDLVASAESPEALAESWQRLLRSLRSTTAELRELQEQAVPEVAFSDIATRPLSPELLKQLRQRGCVVVRGVVDPEEALGWKADLQRYIADNPSTRGFPAHDPAVYELYWSPSQVSARAHPRMQRAVAFANSLWHSDSSSHVSFRHSVTYADRVRIRKPGEAQFALGPHVDGGSLERWEDDEYRAAYSDIFRGAWEQCDLWDGSHRVLAQSDLYNGSGGCSVFRAFQGWLSMSDVGPGEGSLRLAPSLQDFTSYFLLRPLIDLATGQVDLATTSFPGAAMGRGQELTPEAHPHLELESSMVPIPRVQPGDAIFWHADMIHAVDPVHLGSRDSSCLYIPAVPTCESSARYLRRQREAFARACPAPDFPGYPHALGEAEHRGRVEGPRFIERVGGAQALAAMGLRPFDATDDLSVGEREAVLQHNAILA